MRTIKSEPNLSDNRNEIWHIHRGENHFRIILTIVLILLIIISIYAIKHIGFLTLTVIISALIGIISIRYPKLNLKKDGFEIKKKCLIDRFSDSDQFLYNEIKSITFSEGVTNWNKFFILAFLGGGSAGGGDYVAIPDRMIIETKNGNTFIFYRFGSKTSFINTIALIKKQLSK